MKSFIDCKNKREVQKRLFEMITPGLSVTCLCGPDPENTSYIQLMRDTMRPFFIHAYDHNLIMPKTKPNNVFFYKDDIIYAPSTAVIDLDVCGTLLSSKDLIVATYLRQRASIAGPKYLMFTLCTRSNTGYSRKDILKMIGRMFNFELNNRWLSSVSRKNAFYTHDNVVIYCVKYSDGNCPMFTVLIKY